MKLKIGDKVRMTDYGFRFYSDLDKSFEMSTIGLMMNHKHFTQTVCELFAVHGVGVVKKLNDDGDPYIRWEYRLDGVKYHYENYYDIDSIRKLTLLDKLIFKLQGRI